MAHGNAIPDEIESQGPRPQGMRQGEEIAIAELQGPCDLGLLYEIGRLRVAAWSSKTTLAPSIGLCWTDSLDDEAIHWIVKRGERLLGAARLTIHHDLDSIAYGHAFEAWPGRIRFPVGLFGRLVLDPALRGQGISGQLDQLRLAAARRRGVRHVLTFGNPHRLAAFHELGFQVVGESVRWAEFPETLCYPLALEL